MKILKDLNSRKDIELLVNTFYAKIKEDKILGYIFNESIQDKWPIHLKKLADFWESILFDVPKYTGRPGFKHLVVDANFKNIINENHFNQWLAIWHQTCNELFEGDRIEEAKLRATKIGEAQLNHIKINRFKR